MRHLDLKQTWKIAMNGKDVATLPNHEVDTVTFWPIAANMLRDGANDLRIYCTSAKPSNDIRVGVVRLIDRPRNEVLSEAVLDVSVKDSDSNGAMTARSTIVDEAGSLISVGAESDLR